MRELGEEDGYVRSDTCTYCYRVDPIDLCLEFCETHKQDYIIFPLVTCFPRFVEF